MSGRLELRETRGRAAPPAVPRNGPKHSPRQDRAALHERLLAKRNEIQQAVLTRVCSISDPAGVSDPAYREGLIASVSAALDYALETVGRGDQRVQPLPPTLLVQARLAARNGIGLDTVLRRYFAGHSLLSDFLVEEAGEAGLAPKELKRSLRTLSISFDRLLASISAEFERHAQDGPLNSEERRLETARGLLAGELLDASGLGYELDANHLGLAAAGPGGEEAIRELAASLDRRLLVLHPDRDVTWAWLGGRHPFESEHLAELISSLSEEASPDSSLALGEPGEGLAGWRLSHRQALTALPLARRQPCPVARYRDVALLASVLRDDVLAASLHQLYLKPLEQTRDGGEAARATLRRYFATGCNVSSTAASLGVTRNTVSNRLRAVEEAVGQSLTSCASALETALAMSELHAPPLQS